MPRSSLTGSRIRERRLVLGMRQADLAREAGISASYLNLIEHNRRRIGDALLRKMAVALGVEISALTEGTEAALIEGLRQAAAGSGESGPELARLEEFAGHFPGWAQLLIGQSRRVALLERTVETLSDRMTHDPHLSASLHEVLSVITAIRSTAAILAETEDIDPEWRKRFHHNLHADSLRLAEGAAAIVNHLEGSEVEETGLASPQEELEAWLEARGYHVAELEGTPAPAPERIVAGAGELATNSARKLALAYLERSARDARQLPLAPFQAAVDELGTDPGPLARRFGVDLTVVLRRLASVPDSGGLRAGLVICDGSGTLTFRKPAEGFPLPRFGAACPLWPLYQALSRPMAPIRATVEMAGRIPRRFLTYALCQPSNPAGFDGPQVLESFMLIMPLAGPASVGEAAQPVGTGCRICPRSTCLARREPSILVEGV